MSNLRIIVTAPLPDDSLGAFRARHNVEDGVIDMLSYLGAMDVSITSEVYIDGAPVEIKRKRGDPETPEQIEARQPLIEAGNKILTLLSGSLDHDAVRAIWNAALVEPI